ncbi:MAG: archaellin/type IV pilin N-terminal domain-containing protein [Sulfolobales archaeon]
MKKGISPVIATVILVAVALVLAVALAGWVMGIWGGLGATEALQISGYLNKTDTSTVYLNATIINKGTASANITNIVLIDETGRAVSSSSLQEIGGIIVAPGGTNTTGPTYDVKFDANVAVGKTYVVRFYTSSGNVYEVPMKCVKGK